jgi:Flp pilus assembly protein TadG
MRQGERGQSLVETGIVVVFLTFLVLGIMDVGWAFMRTSMIEHSARDGARYGATLANATGLAYRDTTTGCFTGAGVSQIQSRVTSQLNTVGFSASSIAVCQDCSGTIPVTKVTVNGTLDMLFGFIQSSFAVSRDVTFQDEARLNCPGNTCGGC